MVFELPLTLAVILRSGLTTAADTHYVSPSGGHTPSFTNWPTAATDSHTGNRALGAVDAPPAVTYEYIVSTFLRPYAKVQEVEIVGLWGALGLDVENLKDSRGRSLFPAEAGTRTDYMDATTVAWEDLKAIVLSRPYGGAQVLIFRRAGLGSFRFAYEFHADVAAKARRTSLSFLEPEPGLRLAQLRYNSHCGSGIYGEGWSLYRVGDHAAHLLLETDTKGYCAGYRFEGYRCDIEPLEDTWPVLNLTFFADSVRYPGHLNHADETDTVSVWRLRADVEIPWDARRATYEPRANDMFSAADIHALLDDQLAFVSQCIKNGSHQAGPEPILRRIVMKKSAFNSGIYTK